MLWSHQNRFASRNVYHTGPDPAADSGGGQPSSPTIVNFSDYLRKQFAHSKNFFKAATIWSENSLEIPISRSGARKPAPGQQQQKKAKESGSKKKKGRHRRGSVDRHMSSTVLEVPMVPDGWPMDEPSQVCELMEPVSDITSSEVFSPPKIKPIKVMKKKIYTNHYIDDGDVPGPGTYNIATSLVKPTFNRVFMEPPPAMQGAPNYLRQTTASIFRTVDSPTNHVVEDNNDAMLWESPTKQSLVNEMKTFKTTKVNSRLL